MKAAKHDAAGRLLAKNVRCRWCGKQPVRAKRGRIQEHVTPGNARCVGSGQPAAPGAAQ